MLPDRVNRGGNLVRIESVVREEQEGFLEGKEIVVTGENEPIRTEGVFVDGFVIRSGAEIADIDDQIYTCPCRSRYRAACRSTFSSARIETDAIRRGRRDW